MREEEDVTIERDGGEEDGASEEELEASEARADTKLEKLKRELAQSKKERQEYLDGWQRAKADYVNALKRFDGERAALLEAGKLAAIEAFIPALDSLKRAEAHGDIPEGLTGIKKQLEDAAAALGVSRFGAVGDPFDPSLHEALGTDAAASKAEDDTVSGVLESGWRAGERVLRPAKVRVAHYEG